MAVAGRHAAGRTGLRRIHRRNSDGARRPQAYPQRSASGQSRRRAAEGRVVWIGGIGAPRRRGGRRSCSGKKLGNGTVNSFASPLAGGITFGHTTASGGKSPALRRVGEGGESSGPDDYRVA